MSLKLPPSRQGPVAAPRLAVALKYDRQGAPTVTAKGRGAVAERIVAAAREAGVPIEADAILAEALSGLELDEEIPAELYQAVAVLIGFILRSGQSPHPPAA
ncbi:EscU/YscU/HrcU family type III secretion system export apparatus switch protein [Pannonibacter sp. SL95]|uniref:EscU/YscU/HrcU family type III secretion system export apparatus switch protein n=1 Tax=Pannonibacter sp. SL95 TaxID=2995153 RepID=UPI0022763011|nr:EscU/YscU/HrcU family type III secretion system export apparatus switch protein [Pannonibacter sp. SL95]MCY1706012.1 EscU/YscU/HrcU family type III secretion system export apparatus switch protein [Pannonibacter sp. SL95]